MKGIYCAPLLVCCALLLCSEVGTPTPADVSNQQVGVDGNRHTALTPSWVPQPSDIGRVEEQRLLTAVKVAQKALIETPKDATA
ncbi:hypothetical protein F4X10_15095 [Candidatus Poribacteria bacterium]|nr:hypothetical protein [Candidatus Poribacteria bacterium]